MQSLGKRRFLKWSLAATATAALAACGGGDDEPIPTPDIVGVLQADPNSASWSKRWSPRAWSTP